MAPQGNKHFTRHCKCEAHAPSPIGKSSDAGCFISMDQQRRFCGINGAYYRGDDFAKSCATSRGPPPPPPHPPAPGPAPPALSRLGSHSPGTGHPSPRTPLPPRSHNCDCAELDAGNEPIADSWDRGLIPVMPGLQWCAMRQGEGASRGTAQR